MEKICFVGFDTYPVLNPVKGDLYFGGESVQQWLLAKAFAKQGYEVSMVDWDFGQPDGQQIDGIRIWKTYKKDGGIPVLRAVHPRMTSMVRALKNADADVYYQSCAARFTGLVAKYCQARDRMFIFRVAHDTDCVPGQQLVKYWWDKKIYEYGLRRAHIVATQSDVQKRLLSQHYGLDSVVINMVVQQPEEYDEGRDRPIDVLWVNNLRPFKRPDRVLELAKRIPECRITMIGGSVHGHEDLYLEVKSSAARLENLEFVGAVPYDQVNDYFLKTKVFINTSESEGFPNSFLQAWIRGVPVVSFFDPDGLIGSHVLGGVPRDIETMSMLVRELLADHDRLTAMSREARSFAVDRYAARSVVGRYVALIQEQLRGQP